MDIVSKAFYLSRSSNEMEMTYPTNSEAFEAFVNGATSGSNRTGTMSITTLPDGTTVLLDYGWAKIAERDPETGEVTVFEGWNRWAKSQSRRAETTPRHVRNIKKTARLTEGVSVTLSKRNPQAAATPNEVREIGHANIRGE